MMKIEKIVVIFVTLLGFFLLFVSLVSMYNDLTFRRPLEYYVADIFFFAISLLIVAGGMRLYKRILAYEALEEIAVEEILYEKLKPVLEQVAFSTMELDELKTKLETIEREIRTMEDRVTKAPEKAVEALMIQKVTFYVKTIMFTLFFFGVYLFMLNFIIPYENFFYIVLYLIWWVFITSEFDLFNRTEAWVVFSVPILVVPSATIALDTLIGITAVRILVFVTAVLYAYLYYVYAKRLAFSPGEEIVPERTKELLRRILK